jgi:serine/threonine protein kinase
MRSVSEAQKLLNRIAATAWKAMRILKPGGQGITFEVVHTETDQKGVFKLIKTDNELNRQRFLREIIFLSDSRYHHSNIVKVLAHSSNRNDLWYISELGTPLDNYWSEFKRQHTDQPDELVNKAIFIVRELLNGLSGLHAKASPIVHRDIKPANIVVINEKPVLIDFGTVFMPENARLTNMNDAVGNVRFSHDSMMYRLDEVSPWLDIFQLAQLLIWMLSQDPVKNWQRPLDYRYVRYLPLIKPDHVNSLYAFTGSCADESISPKAAADAIKLLDNLFGFPQRDLSSTNLNAIMLAVENVKLNHSVKTATEIAERLEKLQRIDSYATLYTKYHDELLIVIQLLLNDLEKVNLSSYILEKNGLTPDPFITKCKNGQKNHNKSELMCVYRIVADENVHFTLRVLSGFMYDWFTAGRNPFFFQLQAYFGGKSNTLIIAIDKDGLLTNDELGLLPFEKIIQILNSWIADPALWNI